MKKRLLIIGPFPEPITGNSLSNKVVYEGFRKKEMFTVEKINTSLTFFDEAVITTSSSVITFSTK